MLRDRFGENSLYLFYCGRLQYVEGEISESQMTLERFVEINSRVPAAYCLLNTIYVEYNAEYEKAILINEKALRILPKDIGVINNLAYAYLMSNDLENAKRILSKAKNADDNLYITATKGLLAIKEGNVKVGEKMYGLASTLTPDMELRKAVNQKKNLELGKYFLGKKDIITATDYFEKAISVKHKQDFYGKQASKLLLSLHK